MLQTDEDINECCHVSARYKRVRPTREYSPIYLLYNAEYVLLKLNPLNNVNNPLACFSPSHPEWDTAQRSKVWDIV